MLLFYKVVRYSLLVSVFLVVAGPSADAQDRMYKMLNREIESGEGSILLNTGEELKGDIQLNDRSGIVSIVNMDVSKSYIARNVMGFEFFDEVQKRQRVFYALKFKEKKDTVERTFFFEVLRDFTDFAVISKVDPLEVKVKSGNSGTTHVPGSISLPSGDIGATTIVMQTETVYFFGRNGVIKPYYKITRKVVEGRLVDRDKIKHKVFDNTLLGKYFSGEEIAAMQKFSSENHLVFESKEDFIKILASVDRKR